MMHPRSLAFALCLAASPALAQQDDDLCGAAGFQGLVGQSGEIARMLVLDQPVRAIAPNSPVTRDYRLDRINFDLDENGIITVVRCG